MWWHSPERERKETGRVEALSDGVFAIAATLLVLGIPAPTRGGETLSTLVLSHYRWISFITYVVSFLTILVMWVNHHSMFQFVARLDRPFVFANGLLLMLVTFVNYPTALVANFAATSDDKLAAAIYSAVLIVISVVYRVMWFHAVNNGRLLATDVDPDEVAMISRQYRFGWLFYFVAFALALFVNAWASIALNAGLAIYFAFTGRILRSEQKPVAHQYDRIGEQEE